MSNHKGTDLSLLSPNLTEIAPLSFSIAGKPEL